MISNSENNQQLLQIWAEGTKASEGSKEYWEQRLFTSMY